MPRRILILELQLLRSFNQTKTFCDEHQLVINASKSQLIVFQAQGNRLLADFTLAVEGCKITPTHHVKLLGVTLDRYLTFGEHIDNHLCYSRSGRWAGLNSCDVTEHVCNIVTVIVKDFCSLYD